MAKPTRRSLEIQKALRHLRRSDPQMKKLIEMAGPFALKVNKARSIFEALMSAIVYQQLHANAARTIYARVRALFPEADFPNAELILETPDQTFRNAGLSAAKTAAVKDLARHHRDGLIPETKRLHRMTNPEIVDTLTKVRGVGPWTVEMLLIFRLGRLDIMPCTDFGVRTGFALTFRKRQLPSPEALLRYSQKWQPYQSVAAWYFWRAVDMKRLRSKS